MLATVPLSLIIHVHCLLQSLLAVLTNKTEYGRNESCAGFCIVITVFLEESLYVFPEGIKSLKLGTFDEVCM